MDLDERDSLIRTLAENYNPEKADVIIECYLEGLGDVDANKKLNVVKAHRTLEVAKWKEVFVKQDDTRRGRQKRVWSESEMKSLWKVLCSTCLITGISGTVLDINWNRYVL